MDKLIKQYLLQDDATQVNILQVLTFFDAPIKMGKADLDKFIAELQRVKNQMTDNV